MMQVLHSFTCSPYIFFIVLSTSEIPIAQPHVPGSGASTGKEKKQEAKEVTRSDTTKVTETPPHKIRKSSSAPALSREVQSKEVLGDGGASGGSRDPDPSQKTNNVDPGVPAAGKAAAAKTKVVAPKVETPVAPKTETPDPTPTPRTVKAVQECLQRSCTMDSQGSTPTPPPKPSTVATPVDQKQVGAAQVAVPTEGSEKEKSKSSDSESESESSQDEEAEQNKEEQVRRKKEAHARYMRFSRSLTSISSKAFESHCTSFDEI